MSKVKFLLSAAVLLGLASTTNAAPKGEQDKLILHAWSWSLDTIAANMKLIADAGYDFVQTSPVQRCFVGDGGGRALFSQPGDSVMGKWYYYYQPIDWKIGNYMIGTRDDFKQLCDSANKYGVRVLVDVLPNHTAIDHTAVLPGLDNAVGGHENLYHAAGHNEIRDYNDRLQCTTGRMGGLPDVNTENPDFQHYYLQFVNDLISLGCRGFRYDTAKHIGLPSDPLDPKSERNNFWDVATGREAVKGLSLLMPDSLYIYGEVLQDRNTKETEYDDYMDLVASSYGHVLRNVLNAGDTRADNLNNWCHPSAPEQLVTWVESHDTYCNHNESASLTDEQIRTGWVFLAARATGRPLFYSRPAGSTRENYWGTNRIGNRGNDEFMHPQVVAANKFRHVMNGQPEKLLFSDNGAISIVERGKVGAALINFSGTEQLISMKTALPKGTYTDAVSGSTFTVKNGNISGTLAPHSTYIIYCK